MRRHPTLAGAGHDQPVKLLVEWGTAGAFGESQQNHRQYDDGYAEEATNDVGAAAQALTRIDRRRSLSRLVGQRIQRHESKDHHHQLSHLILPLRTDRSDVTTATIAHEDQRAIATSTFSKLQKPTHDRDEYLWLLAMHPVASSLDRDELNAREQSAHRGSVFGLNVG